MISQANISPNTPLGANLVSAGGATFRAWAPLASAVYINGTFGGAAMTGQRLTFCSLGMRMATGQVLSRPHRRAIHISSGSSVREAPGLNAIRTHANWRQPQHSRTVTV